MAGLRCDADAAEGPEVVAFADLHRSLHEAVASKSVAGSNPDPSLEQAVGTYFNVFREFDLGVDDGRGVDAGHGVWS